MTTSPNTRVANCDHQTAADGNMINIDTLKERTNALPINAIIADSLQKPFLQNRSFPAYEKIGCSIVTAGLFVLFSGVFQCCLI